MTDPWKVVDEYRRSRAGIEAAVTSLRRSGVSAVEIAERMGISSAGVYRIINRAKKGTPTS